MKRYDPDQPIHPKRWLAADENQRLDLIRKYHRTARIHLPNPHRDELMADWVLAVSGETPYKIAPL